MFGMKMIFLLIITIPSIISNEISLDFMKSHIDGLTFDRISWDLLKYQVLVRSQTPVLPVTRVAEVARACERRSPKSLDSDENFKP